jgi:hypothetical protein
MWYPRVACIAIVILSAGLLQAQNSRRTIGSTRPLDEPARQPTRVSEGKRPERVATQQVVPPSDGTRTPATEPPGMFGPPQITVVVQCVVELPPQPVVAAVPAVERVRFDRVEEGYDVVLLSYDVSPLSSGFAFSNKRVVAYDAAEADMYCESTDGEYYMIVGRDSEILDAGKCSSVFDFRSIMIRKWADEHYVPLFEGNAYVLRRWDGSYALFRIKSLRAGMVTFDWIYQTNDPAAPFGDQHDRWNLPVFRAKFLR